MFTLGEARLAFSTDSFVVQPLFFPGGSIGDLAVNGTVNDLAMSGAQAAYLSCGFILEEGVELTVVGRIATDHRGRRAPGRRDHRDRRHQGRRRGSWRWRLINTAGVGLVPAGVDIRPAARGSGGCCHRQWPHRGARDRDHERARGESIRHRVVSDCAPLNGLVAAMLAVCTDLHVLRDPTRGGVATSLNEIAKAAGVGIELIESALPVPETVANACAFLGLDPLYVANEGKLLAIVARDDADAVLAAMRADPLGADAAVIGECVEAHPGMVVTKTAFGATRVVDTPIGEQLPRIC